MWTCTNGIWLHVTMVCNLNVKLKHKSRQILQLEDFNLISARDRVIHVNSNSQDFKDGPTSVDAAGDQPRFSDFMTDAQTNELLIMSADTSTNGSEACTRPGFVAYK